MRVIQVERDRSAGVIEPADRDQVVDQDARQHGADVVQRNRGDGLGRFLIGSRRALRVAAARLNLGDLEQRVAAYLGLGDHASDRQGAGELLGLGGGTGDDREAPVVPDGTFNRRREVGGLLEEFVGQSAERRIHRMGIAGAAFLLRRGIR